MTRRDEILQAASSLFATSGYSNTSMRDIADGCGLLAGSLYSHFRSKAEILRLIIEPFFAELIPVLERGVEEPGSGADRLDTTIASTFEVLLRFPDEVTILHYSWTAIAEMDDLAAVHERSNRVLQLWHQLVLSGIKDGSLREGVDPELALRLITSSQYGVLDRKRYDARTSVVGTLSGEVVAKQLVMVLSGGLRSSH